MERYNPFAVDSTTSLNEDPDPFSSQPVRKQLSASSSSSLKRREVTMNVDGAQTRQTSLASRYSTSFPDPFGEDPSAAPPPPPPPPPLQLGKLDSPPLSSRPTRQTTFASPTSAVSSSLYSSGGLAGANRTNSVTFLHQIDQDDETERGAGGLGSAASPGHLRGHQQRGESGGSGRGFGSFLSRATSVTSSSVTDRVTGAVGSVKSAVDSLSNQIQSAVPTNLAQSGASFMSGSGSNLSSPLPTPLSQPTSATTQAGAQMNASEPLPRQPQQSAASYLASKLTSQLVGASGQSVSGSGGGGGGGSMPVICRQRVMLILESPLSIDWPAQFQQHRRLLASSAGGIGASPSSGFTSFLASQFSTSASSESGADLIEQADYSDASVLANQSSSTVIVLISGPSALINVHSSGSSSNRLLMLGGGASSGSSPALQQGPGAAAVKLVRPEFVVVRQRARENAEHLRSLVKALNYCSVPTFESYDVWSVFQDRQLVFAKLLRVQKRLGKENFPLIPQIYCQTHQDLFNYLNNSTITLPCLLRTGPLGKGKIKIESIQMLRDVATIMATSKQSCTIEPYLDVKCDLIVQRLGASLKLFRTTGASKGARQSGGASKRDSLKSSGEGGDSSPLGQRASIPLQQALDMPPIPSPGARQTAARQTSLGSGVLSSLISTTSSGLQQVTSSVSRRTSNPLTSTPCAYEKLSDVNVRYRSWASAIAAEFGEQIDAFAIKIVVANNDREYIVGLSNCSMEFLGSQENQEEDRRSFVELIMSKMNSLLPQHQPNSREASATAGGERKLEDRQPLRRTNSVDKAKQESEFMSADLSGGSRPGELAADNSQRVSSSPGQLNNRARSISMNQNDSAMSPTHANRATQLQSSPNRLIYQSRRSSDRGDGQATGRDEQSMPLDASQSSAPTLGSGQRQMSLGQSIFEQTSTAFGSLQKQSMSFLKRLDSRTGADLIGGGTPPPSAKSDSGLIERNFPATDGTGLAASSAPDPMAAAQRGSQAGAASTRNGARAGLKSQSIDAGSLGSGPQSGRPGRPKPPPPPPPPSAQLQSMNRQSSMAGYSTSSRSNFESGAPVTPTQTPAENTFVSGSMESVASAGSSASQRKTKIVRRTSALSAFEPFDPELQIDQPQDEADGPAGESDGSRQQPATAQRQQRDSVDSIGSAKRRLEGTSASAQRNSGGADESGSAEDTMNNLKKTFASIFGDKCD